MKRIPELDGLRAVAALLVIAWHYIGIPDGPTYWLWNLFYLGHFGVDLFFVLSGFLITTILIENRDSPSYFSSFYARRALRIWPIYYLMVFVCLVGWATRASPNLFAGSVPWWTYLFGIQNFWMAHLATYGSYWLGGTWSLAIEEQFYLLFPLAIRFVPLWLVRKALITIVIVCPLARLINSFDSNGFSYYVLPFYRADVLAIGAFIALARIDSPSDRLTKLVKIAFAGALIFVLMIPISGSSTFHAAAWQHTAAAVFFGAVVYLVLENQGSQILRPLRSEACAKLANWSYASYMIHHWVAYLVFASLGVTRTMTTIPGVATTALSFILTFSMCAISYRFLEKPLIKYAHRRYSFDTEREFAIAKR